jgi:aryl-alcohol dehydrogenase-like predicted oxidoreductase
VTHPSIQPWITPKAGAGAGTTAALAVGTMNFGKRTPEAESVRIIERAIERGLLFFDTANAYNDGESERILGRALKKRREEVFIATKVGFGRVAGKPEGLPRETVLRAAGESLTRLQTDYIDLYYLHVPDYSTPIEETLDAVEELMRAGKIRRFGVSNYASWQVLQMMMSCDRRGISRPAVSQVLYNMLIRQLDIEYFKFTREFPVHTSVYNALAGGLLSGRHERSAPIPKGSRFDGNKLYRERYWSDRFFGLVDEYRAVASDEGMSLLELAYAWLAGRGGVDSILVGPASVEQLDAAIDACAKPVSPEARARIDGISRAFLGTDASYTR